MDKFKRLVAYGGFLGFLAAMVFAIPASASVKGDCVIDGVLKMQDKDDPHSGVRVLGGQGKFTFQSLAVNCLADTNKDLVSEVVIGLRLSATGWVDNTVCGTGKAFGTVGSVIGGPAKLQTVAGEAFAIQLVGPVGVFKWLDWDKPDLATPKPSNPDDQKPEPDGAYTSAGTLNLTTLTGDGKPTPTLEEALENLQRGHCAKVFRLTGSIALDFDA